MAFQRHAPFHAFLRTTAACSDLDRSAPAANFLLEERLSEARENGFSERLAKAQTDSVSAGIDIPVWHTAFLNQFCEEIAVRTPRRCQTFAAGNATNVLSAVAPEQDVLRLESIKSLYDLTRGGGFSSVERLRSALIALVQSRATGTKLDVNTMSLLRQWLGELNRRRDARPAFVTPFDEHENTLKRDDWATHLRNVLGLAHLGGTTETPLPVVLMRYNLTRVADAARRDRSQGWAVAPTVLEAGGNSGPGTAFIPYPPGVGNGCGYGCTVSLSNEDDGLDYQWEMLHYYVDYELDDFYRVGMITDVIDNTRLKEARWRHLDLHGQDFRFLGDLP